MVDEGIHILAFADQEGIGHQLHRSPVDLRSARGTQLAEAQVSTLRVKLLKIGARVITSARRIVLHLPSSFPLAEVFGYLHPTTARDVLIQALLPAPMFGTRWRWNAQRALLLDRSRNGKRVPAALVRMRAEDLLVAAFPQVLACPETLPGGPLEVPDDHPIVRQTVEDCLTEPMDVDGFLAVLHGLVDEAVLEGGDRRYVSFPAHTEAAVSVKRFEPLPSRPAWLAKTARSSCPMVCSAVWPASFTETCP